MFDRTYCTCALAVPGLRGLLSRITSSRSDVFRKEARETNCFRRASQPKLPKCDGRSGRDATETSVDIHGQSDCLSASSFGAIDVADYYQQRDEEKYRVLVNAFRPDSNYHFPSHEDSMIQSVSVCLARAVQLAVILSIVEWRVLCTLRTVFSIGAIERSQLTTSALRNFTRACQTLKEHACQISRNSSMESAAVFMDQMDGRALPVHSQVVTGRAKKISENRRKISLIVVYI